MFFFLSKVLHILIEPFTWILILFIVSLLLKGKRRKRCLITTLVVFLLFSNKLVIRIPEKLYESKHIELTANDSFRYAVVLGGYSAYDNKRQTVNFHTSVDRLISGLKLQDEGIVGHLILSGGAGSLSKPNLREAGFVHEFWPQVFKNRSYTLETESRNTYENALKCHHILEAKNALNDEILLITSAVHMPRAMASFRKQGIRVKAYPVDFLESGVVKWYDFFLPNIQTLSDWNRYMHEWVGWIMYKVRGYL